MTTFLIATISTTVYILSLILGEVYVDHVARKTGVPVNPPKGYRFRLMMSISCIAIGVFHGNDYIYNWSLETWEIIGYWLGFITFAYWFLRDFLMNILGGQDIFYIGTTAKTDKRIRKYLGPKAGFYLVPIKVVLATLFFIFYTNSWLSSLGM